MNKWSGGNRTRERERERGERKEEEGGRRGGKAKSTGRSRKKKEYLSDLHCDVISQSVRESNE